MSSYRPYPITIFARETTNQVEVALASDCFVNKHIKICNECPFIWAPTTFTMLMTEELEGLHLFEVATEVASYP